MGAVYWIAVEGNEDMTVLESYNKSPYLSVKHSTYFQVYDKLFSHFKDDQLTFVEVGVFNGGSLFMWRDFLGEKARIIGIDLSEKAKKWEEHGFEIFTGSQTNPQFWKEFYQEVGNIDVLLDDGGHMYEQQIMTCVHSLPHINDGGLLVLEDTHTSYMKDFGGPSGVSLISYAKNIIDGINYRFGEFAEAKECERQIFSVEFFESIVAFKIDRSLSEVKSEPISNGGENSGATDLRYFDDFVISATNLAKCFKY